jgi:hypothetical protein
MMTLRTKDKGYPFIIYSGETADKALAVNIGRRVEFIYTDTSGKPDKPLFFDADVRDGK